MKAYILVFILLAGCAFTGEVVKEEPIKIGILTPLTGDLAFLGENIVKSAELAAEVQGIDVEFIIEDAGDVGGGKSAVSAYQKLVHQDDVVLIIDGMASDGTMAVAPLLAHDEVVMITPLTGGENIDLASPYLFRNGPSDIKAGTQPAIDLFEKGYVHVAVISDNAAYTTDIAKHFRTTFQGTIVLDALIPPDKTDYRDVVAKVLHTQPEAIVINTASGMSSNYLIKQLAEAGNEAAIFANFLAFNGNTLPVAGDAIEGVHIYDPEFAESEEVQAFFAQYGVTYQHAPTIPFHTTGTYDALALFHEAENAVGYEGRAVRSYLLNNIKQWQGMNGNVTFDERGNTDTGFVLKQIRQGKVQNI